MEAKRTFPALHYLNNGHGLASWLLTKDYKRIAIMYLISISVFFFIGSRLHSRDVRPLAATQV